MISGSFRAFDRRPLEKERVNQFKVNHHDINENPFGANQAIEMDASSSFEISHLHNAQLQEDVGVSNSTNWDVNNNDNGNDVDFQEPLWEWECGDFKF